MKKKLCLLLMLPFVVGCSSTPASSEQPSSQAPSSEQPSSQTPSSEAPSGEKYLFYNIKSGETKEGLTGAPWLNVMTPGIVSKIEKPSLKDDFFVSTNYDYLSTATLKEGQIGDGGTLSALVKLQENYENLGTKDTLKGDYAAANRKAYALYKENDKTKDIAAVTKLLNKVKAIQNKGDLIRFISSLEGATFLWSYFDIMRLSSGITLIEDAFGWSMYNTITPFINNDESGKTLLINGYASILSYFGIEEQEAKTIVNDGLQLDADYRNSSDIPSSSGGYTVGNIDETFTTLNLKQLFRDLDYEDNVEINIFNPVYNILTHLDRYTDEAETQRIKNNLIVRVCVGAKAVLPDDKYVELAQQFNQNAAGYNEEMLLRDRYVESLRNVFDRAYVDNFETAERKASMIEIMTEVKNEYKNVINDASWLGSETKQKAQEKLDAIRFDCCYPESLLSLPAFTIGDNIDNFYDAVCLYRDWSFKGDQPAASNPEMWSGTITLLNAIYSLDSNSFTVYEGILAGNEYTADDIEGIYASIGTVIGHEISHSFDDNGSHYDAHGQMSEWWTAEDRAAFNQKTQKIVNAWNQISYKDGVQMWSAEMLGEIIADMGGMSVILKLASKKENFDYAKFFNEYSKSYASVLAPQFVDLMYYERKDAHPMNYLRVNNVVNQFTKFHEVFGITEGDKMYTNEADRLPIW